MGVEGNELAHLARVTINWTGFIGAPGYTNLYWRNSTPGTISQAVVNDAITKTDTWLATWKARFPLVVSTGIDPTVEVIEDSDGTLQGFMTGTPAAASFGTGTGQFSAATGAVVNWYTGTVRNGRRIRGRSFLVPLIIGAYDTDGTIANSTVASMRTQAATLHAATGDSRLVVWGRPTAPGATDGVSAEVITSTVPDKVAILSSRRD